MSRISTTDVDAIAKSPIAATSSQGHRRKSRSLTAMHSARSSNSYERLEGGHGGGRPSKRFQSGTWKKFAVAAVVLIGLVWVFGPRESKVWKDYGYGDSIAEDDFDDMVKGSPIGNDNLPSTINPVHDDSGLPNTFPTNPTTDPDLLKTVHCNTPYSSSLPLVQYALMIDAGSTGSRIHIYKFNNCGASPMYEYEVFKQRQPGLSYYKGQPLKAAESLDELLDEAVKTVPKALWKCTPVAVKATAGLRLLGNTESSEILQAVRLRLREKYDFNLRSDEDVVIMEGKDEGVFAWITANYLLNTIRGNTPAGTPSYAVLDLGGASTQIVFEPQFDEKRPDSMLEPGEHKYELEFGGKKRVLYQHSYLGYGLMKARESVHRLVDFLAPETDTIKGSVANPCLAPGTMKSINVTEARTDAKRLVQMDGADIGSFDACNRVIQLVMAKDAICEVKPCSFNGVYQPSLLETFPQGKILLLSYFYDRINPLLTSEESAKPIEISTIAKLATDVCLGKPSWSKRWGSNSEAMTELEGRPEWCLDLTFMYALLRLGYEFDDGRQAVIGKQIDGTELGWCLGATIAMVGADLKCRV